MRDVDDARLMRYLAACQLTPRKSRPNDPEWIKALNEAVMLDNALHEHYSPTFEVTEPRAAFKPPHKYVDGYHVALDFRTILSLELTWSELDVMAHQVELQASEILDQVLRAKILQSIGDLKREIERKNRSHLRVVP